MPYNTPGGHSMHPSFPLEEELINVPFGQGLNVFRKCGISPGISLPNPEAIKADSRARLAGKTGRLTVTAPTSEFKEFLGKTREGFMISALDSV